MPDGETERRYRGYIRALNDRRLDLGEFVHEELTYNGEPMTRFDYQNLIARGIAAIPDLVYDVDFLVISGDRIACRLVFRCTPEAEFLGLQPSGKTVTFAEHVFYLLRGGKISEVRSLIDRHALAEQLSG